MASQATSWVTSTSHAEQKMNRKVTVYNFGTEGYRHSYPCSVWHLLSLYDTVILVVIETEEANTNLLPDIEAELLKKYHRGLRAILKLEAEHPNTTSLPIQAPKDPNVESSGPRLKPPTGSQDGTRKISPGLRGQRPKPPPPPLIAGAGKGSPGQRVSSGASPGGKRTPPPPPPMPPPMALLHSRVKPLQEAASELPVTIYECEGVCGFESENKEIVEAHERTCPKLQEAHRNTDSSPKKPSARIVAGMKLWAQGNSRGQSGDGSTDDTKEAIPGESVEDSVSVRGRKRKPIDYSAMAQAGLDGSAALMSQGELLDAQDFRHTTKKVKRSGCMFCDDPSMMDLIACADCQTAVHRQCAVALSNREDADSLSQGDICPACMDTDGTWASCLSCGLKGRTVLAMVLCQSCGLWIHADCAGVSDEQMMEVNRFTCGPCKRKPTRPPPPPPPPVSRTSPPVGGRVSPPGMPKPPKVQKMPRESRQADSKMKDQLVALREENRDLKRKLAQTTTTVEKLKAELDQVKAKHSQQSEATRREHEVELRALQSKVKKLQQSQAFPTADKWLSAAKKGADYKAPAAAKPEPKPAEAGKAEPAAKKEPPTVAAGDLPPNWRAYEDDEDGTLYYHNSATGATQWEKPAA